MVDGVEGTVFGGRYELREQLGRGGMATVYLADDQLLDRAVAVKILHPALVHDEQFVERFRREARAAARLNHPHIVGIYDLGVEGETYYIVMEYVPGPTLKEFVRSAGRLSETHVLQLVGQIADSLEAAHRQGIIHRDVKPQNVLMARPDHAKVTDFGIARAAGASQITATHIVLGSVHYASPEQLSHETVDARSDLYSLGVVMYELLAGRLPFEGEITASVAWQQVTQEPRPLAGTGQRVSAVTEQMVMQLLEKRPEDRFQTAADVREAIREALQQIQRSDAPTVSMPIPRPRVVPTSPTGQRQNRSSNPIPVFIAIAGALLLSLGAWAALAGDLLPLMGNSERSTAPPESQRSRREGASLAEATSTVHVAPVTLPTAVPTPMRPRAAPTATAAPRVQAPPPTATAAVGASIGTPAEAVLAFYNALGRGDLDVAASYWSSRMKAQYPPVQFVYERFRLTRAISVRRAEVLSLDQAAGRAVVAVDLVEVSGDPPVTDHWVGTWEMTLGPNGWLLDQPHLAPA